MRLCVYAIPASAQRKSRKALQTGGSKALCVFGKAMTSLIEFTPPKYRGYPIQPESHASVRGHSVFKGFQQRSKAFFHLFCSITDHLEHSFLQLRVFYPDGPRTELPTIANKVEQLTSHIARGILQYFDMLLPRGRKNVVSGSPFVKFPRPTRTEENP